jgi:membrane protein implicated in regulation of membrane protease activity
MEVRDMLLFALVILVAIGALFMIDANGGWYGLGMALFAVAVIAGFWLIKRYFDRSSAGPR